MLIIHASAFKVRPLSVSALIIAVGILLSGPIGKLIIQIVHRPEAWKDVEDFIDNYSYIMPMPIAFAGQYRIYS